MGPITIEPIELDVQKPGIIVLSMFSSGQDKLLYCDQKSL